MDRLKKVLLVFLILAGAFQWSPLEASRHSKKKSHKNSQEFVEGQTILIKFPLLGCYGHALLDGVIPLYVCLRANNLLDVPVNVVMITKDLDPQINNGTSRNVLQLIHEIYKVNRVMIIRELDVKKIENPKLYTNGTDYEFENLIIAPSERYYSIEPHSTQYLEQLKKFGYKDTLLIHDPTIKANPTIDFIQYLFHAYDIHREDYPRVQNRILVAKRYFSPRVILNGEELEIALAKAGYDVQIADFEKLSVKEQIMQVMQADYLIGAAGSNLTNAMFLQPGAKAMVIYPKDTRYGFRNRDTITSAIVSSGTELIEYEKPEYDQRDVYFRRNRIAGSDFLIRDGNIIRLRSDRINETYLKKLPPCSELYHVDFYVDVQHVLDGMHNPVPALLRVR